jgi:hypothetical protein
MTDGLPPSSMHGMKRPVVSPNFLTVNDETIVLIIALVVASAGSSDPSS